eukprot:gene11647-15599_t
MRLPKHKLPKQIFKAVRTAKHKDSELHQKHKAAKINKSNEMEVGSVNNEVVDANGSVSGTGLTEEEKAVAKAARKKANAHKVHYKKTILHITNKYGPRACNR